MIKKLILIFLIPFLFSCYHENKVVVEKPDPLIDRETMIDILADLHVAEGIISHNRKQREKTNKAYKDSLYQRLFDHYHINGRILKENINYYNVDPADMEEMYEEVLEKLSKTQSEILMDTVKQEVLIDSLIE